MHRGKPTEFGIPHFSLILILKGRVMNTNTTNPSLSTRLMHALNHETPIRPRRPLAKSILALALASTVTAGIANADSPEGDQGSFLIAAQQVGNVFEIRIPDRSPGVFVLECSTELVHWKVVSTNAQHRAGLVFKEPFSKGTSHRFYRVRRTEEAPYVPRRVGLRFKSNATQESVADAMAVAGLEIETTFYTQAMEQDGIRPIYYGLTDMPVHAAVEMLMAHPAVEHAQPDWVYFELAKPNEPSFSDGTLWDMYGDNSSPANAFGCQAAEAWDQGHTGSSTVHVGIIDSGVQNKHVDLVANMWSNSVAEIPGNGIDDDRNGFVDDTEGWDFANGDGSVFDGVANQPCIDQHGTHVAGTIGAQGNNGRGIVGVNWSVTMIPTKFLSASPGSCRSTGSGSDAVRAVDYLIDLKQRHHVNLVAINNSWGPSTPGCNVGYDAFLHEAIIRAAKRDILFVVAAGNFGTDNDTCPQYPASYDTTQSELTWLKPASFNSVISVASINRDGGLASYSNHGKTTVHLGAPGDLIASTAPVDGYIAKSGTSMAAPHVTGAIALFASTHPGTSAAEIRNALLRSTAWTPSLDGTTATGGRLDLSTIVNQPTGYWGRIINIDRNYSWSLPADAPDGSASKPFTNLSEAIGSARDGDTLHFSTKRGANNAYAGALQMAKRVLIETDGGTVRIGP